ncbi:MAG: tetratricopeptide repeat protein [Acidobacteriota bacterium]
MSPTRASGRRRSAAPTAPAADPGSRFRALLALLIVVVGVATYWNSLNAPFVWDDQTAIVTNKTIQHLWPVSEPLAPPRETPVAGRPLVNLSFAFNYAFGGLAQPSYHAVNIAIHIACALLLFAIVGSTLANSRMPVGFRTTANSTAAAAALVWLVHPLTSEVVDYVTQRSESLMAFFFLLTMFCAMRARAQVEIGGRGRAGRESTKWQALSIAACACGMASKESMVVAPIVVALYDRVFEFDSAGEAWRRRRSLYAGLAATWIVLAALAWTTPRSTVGSTLTIGPWLYLLNQFQMIGRYLTLSLWPGALVLDYGLPRTLAVRDVAPAALVVMSLLAGAGLALVRWPRAGFLAAAFFLTLAPTSSIVPILSEVGAERRMYLPLAALATLVVVGGRYALSLRRSSAAMTYAAAGLTTMVIAALAIRTVARNAEYADPVTLWTTVVDRFPHGRARMALATELIDLGRHAQAIAILRQAVPDFPDARAALGTELVLQRQIEEGMAVLREFIAADPSNVNRIPAYALLGETLTGQKDLEGAAREWRAIVSIAPSDPGARAQLARTLLVQAETRLRQGDGVGGEPYAREAVQLTPTDPAAHNLWGAALASSGRLEEAITHFQEALRLAPNDPQARANLERARRFTSTSPLRPRSGEPDPR